MPSTTPRPIADPFVARHYAELRLRDAWMHARGWSAQFRSEMAYARRYAGTPFWKSAWEIFERALTVTGPHAVDQWQNYRSMRAAFREEHDHGYPESDHDRSLRFLASRGL